MIRVYIVDNDKVDTVNTKSPDRRRPLLRKCEINFASPEGT